MQLRLEDIFKGGVADFKSNWFEFAKNTFLFNVTFIVMVLVATLLMMIPLGVVAAFFGFFSVFLGYIALFIGMLSFYLILFYIIKVRGFIIAKSSMENKRLREVSKSVITKENILVKITKVDLPFIAVSLVATLITAICFQLNLVLGVVCLFAQIIIMIGMGFILNSKFGVALYTNSENLKSAYVEVEKKFTNKEIYYVYFMEIISIIIVGIVLRLTLIIPLFGVILVLFQYMFYAMINYQVIKFVKSKVTENQSNPEIDYNENEVSN